MKRMTVIRSCFGVILLFLLCNATLDAQSITVSPHSMSFWGKTPSMAEFSVEYRNVGIHYFHTYEDTPFEFDNKDVRVESSPALSFTPINIRDIIRGGVMVTPIRFPIDSASYFNFILDFGYQVRSVRISYRHVSNGVGGFGRFGIFPKTNPGIDFISITLFL